MTIDYAGKNGDDGISKATEKSQLNTLPVFIRRCESIDAVQPAREDTRAQPLEERGRP